jgi:hypothetical protein
MERVIDCRRVPSPPARMTAQRSLRFDAEVNLRIEGLFENRCWGEMALMIIGFLMLD